MVQPTLLLDHPPTPITTPTKKVYVETLGCQMNLNDSELMLGLLKQAGFEPEADKNKADLLILNTCQIRGAAEDRAYSHLGIWGKLKRKRPHIKIAMAGCVSQQAKDSVFKRMPYVDMVFGTQNLQDLPQLVKRAFEGERHVLAVDKQKPRSTYDYVTDVTPIRESDISAWVTIIEGCDYFCTYCVVPYTRGRQISRAPQSIIDEVKKLADAGFKEITLLGQTVDAYGKDFTGNDAHYGMAKLLEALHPIEGIERIRFMTSHPLDLSDDIIEAVATLPKVMEHIHIPMQSGDTDVLERMKRGYTADDYYRLVDKLYDRIPNVGVSGDYIVGFPGETEAQFEASITSVARSGLCRANTAKYSARQQTPAGIWEARGEEVAMAVKEDRLQRLNDAIEAQALRFNQTHYANTVQQVLVEGLSKRNPNRLMGRTRHNTVVNFSSPLASLALEQQAVGQLLSIRIDEVNAWNLLGEAIS
jgi:tRNA-2-methylthio-N6-dimethylallyladenosine synthase